MPFMMEFLYFPEDKTEYIPAVISLGVFIALAVLVMFLIMRVSKKQEERTEEQFGHQQEKKESLSYKPQGK
ncbi:hypothetical protein SAMN05421743_114110 [Thalassobacillus cyri]|uniref:Uncharacterized protein n=2 Tax=Thalassobacillus cyri TaxID=571932 RepID=A0A1H4G8W8_9BACI|nr:hypothetical protein SAMN05421743_114110 [Thalassobacillus cyri]